MEKYNMQMSDHWENIQILHTGITVLKKCFSVSWWKEKYCKCSWLYIKVIS